MFTFKDTPHEYEWTFVGWNSITVESTNIALLPIRRYTDEYDYWMFENELWEAWHSVLVF